MGVIVGVFEGFDVGEIVGDFEGDLVGMSDGVLVGLAVGGMDGLFVGLSVGAIDGLFVGLGVGAANGDGAEIDPHPDPVQPKLCASPTSTVASSHELDEPHATEQSPVPQSMMVFPLHASGPSQVRAKSVAEFPSI